jgi:hypothetical protein
MGEQFAELPSACSSKPKQKRVRVNASMKSSLVKTGHISISLIVNTTRQQLTHFGALPTLMEMPVYTVGIADVGDRTSDPIEILL